MDGVHLVTFATPDFQRYQQDLIASGKKYGITKGFHYTKSDLENTEFFSKHADTFSQPRGFGFWLWKPYFILESLRQIDDGDIIFYTDSGCLFLASPEPLVHLARTNASGMVFFDHTPVPIRQFTKRDTFVNMGCDNEYYWNATKIMAGIQLIRKSESAVKFIEEWLRACENPGSLSDAPNVQGKENLDDFIVHREDQSIFSILVRKHGLETYRDPSQWGNFRKMPGFRVHGERVCYPWGLNDSISDYSEEPAMNSPYGTLFDLNRKQADERPQPRTSGLRRSKQAILSFLKSILRT